MNPVMVIFDHWNSYKGQGYGCAKWRSHSKLNLPTENAIRKRLRQRYTVEDLCKAIDNYATVLLSPDYKWTYAWTLLEFLTRHRPDRRDEEQLWRWLEGEFEPDDYIKPEVKRRRADEKRWREEQVQRQAQLAQLPTKEERETIIKKARQQLGIVR